MKRVLTLILSLIIILISIIACNTPSNLGNSETTTGVESTTAGTTETAETTSTSDTSKSEVDLSEVTSAFQQKLKSLLPNGGEFCLVDLDQDGIVEIILYGEYINFSFDSYILRYYNGRVLQYYCGSMSFTNPAKDGVFGYHGSAGHIYGGAKIVFTSTITYDVIVLTEILNDGSESAEYYIEGNSATLEELLEYQAKFCSEHVEKHNITEENIEKYVVIDAVTQGCQCKH